MLSAGTLAKFNVMTSALVTDKGDSPLSAINGLNNSPAANIVGFEYAARTEQEHHQAFILYIDPSPTIWLEEDVFERMCAMAASLAEDLYQQDRLKGGQVAGEEMIPIGAIDGLYAFLDILGELERKPGAPGSKPDHPLDTIYFSPGSSGVVLAQTEEGIVGQA